MLNAFRISPSGLRWQFITLPHLENSPVTELLQNMRERYGVWNLPGRNCQHHMNLVKKSQLLSNVFKFFP